MADESETAQLTNGETHEMTDMNEDDMIDKGRKNDGFDEEETHYMPNGTTDNADIVITVDSGVDIAGTDSDPNVDGGGSPDNGIVDEEDGLFESNTEEAKDRHPSFIDTPAAEETSSGSIQDNKEEGRDRHPSFIDTPVAEETSSEAAIAAEAPSTPISTASPVQSPVPQPPDYPPPPPPPNVRGAESSTTAPSCTYKQDGDTGENECKLIKKAPSIEVKEEATDTVKTDYTDVSEAPWPQAYTDSQKNHFVYTSSLDPGMDSETATEYENGTLTSVENATYEETPPEDGLETPKYTPPGSPSPDYEHQINMENGDAGGDKFKFVQHEGADEETVRLESRRTFKRKTDCKCICLSVLCFMVMILAAAFAFFVAMFVLGSLDGFLGRDTTESAPPMRPRGMMIEAPSIQTITAETRFSIELDWIDVYDFPSAPERQNLQNNIIRDLNGIFRWGITEYVYQKTEILEFSRGPYGENVFVEFISYFYDVPDNMVRVPDGTTSPSEDELYEYVKDDMTQIVYDLLMKGIENGRLSSVRVEDDTLELLDVEITRGTP